jgi:hypothetical protein
MCRVVGGDVRTGAVWPCSTRNTPRYLGGDRTCVAATRDRHVATRYDDDISVGSCCRRHICPNYANYPLCSPLIQCSFIPISSLYFNSHALVSSNSVFSLYGRRYRCGEKWRWEVLSNSGPQVQVHQIELQMRFWHFVG